MKSIIYLLIGMPLLVHAQNEKGIRFEQGLSWQQVKEKAKHENKYIFVDCYATWCAPCKAVEKYVFSNEKVGAQINEKFIAVRAQMDTSKGDDQETRQWYGDAHAIQDNYKITAFPTFLFFSPDGNIVHKDLGFEEYQNPETFIGLINDATDPARQYFTLLNKFQQGKLDTAYMKYLARKANQLEEPALAANIANTYINALSDKELYAPDNLRFMYEFTKTTRDRGFSVFRYNADKIYHADTSIGLNASEGLLINIIYKEDMQPYAKCKNGKPDWERIEANTRVRGELGRKAYTMYKPGLIFNAEIAPALKAGADWKKVLPLVKEQRAGRGEEFLVGSTVVFYANALTNGLAKDCKNLIAAGTYYKDNFPSFTTGEAFNEWAWRVFLYSSDRKELNIALSWCDKAIKMSPKPVDWALVDTYANILYKLGNKADALNWEQKAAELAPDDKEITNNLSKMKNGEPTWSTSEEKHP